MRHHGTLLELAVCSTERHLLITCLAVRAVAQREAQKRSGGGGGLKGVDEATAVDYLHSLGTFRPKTTVFETDAKSSRTATSTGFDIMASVRFF